MGDLERERYLNSYDAIIRRAEASRKVYFDQHLPQRLLRSHSMHAAIARFTPFRLIVSGATACAVLAAVPHAAGAQDQSARPVVYSSPSGLTLRLIFGDSGIGPEVSMGELTFPPNLDSGDHAHGATEVLYVLSGELEHTVNGVTTILKPGMAGFVRPPGKIRHKTGPAGAKVLVVWAPGDEAARIAARWKREP